VETGAEEVAERRRRRGWAWGRRRKRCGRRKAREEAAAAMAAVAIARLAGEEDEGSRPTTGDSLTQGGFWQSDF
jgi:hypothetical protein